MTIDRRQFVVGSLAGLGTCALSACGTGPAPAGDGGRLFEVSLAQWSLHRRLRGQQQPAIDNLDFARVARSFDIDAIEYVNAFFRDRADDRDYLAEMKRRADGEGVRSLLIMCDNEGRIGDPDASRRERAVGNHHRWVEAAAFLGCHSIRVNAASAGDRDEQRRLAADGLRRLTEFAAPRGICVLVENHGGLSSDGAWLASVIETVDHPCCGTLPDFGNFRLADGKTYDRYRGVAELMPFAKAVSAKSYDFDAEGNETTIDYRRMLRIVVDAGYHGWIGVEYEGRRLPEDDGIRATAALLRRVRGELEAAGR